MSDFHHFTFGRTNPDVPASNPESMEAEPQAPAQGNIKSSLSGQRAVSLSSRLGQKSDGIEPSGDQLGQKSDGIKPLGDRLGKKSSFRKRIPLNKRLGQKSDDDKPFGDRLGKKWNYRIPLKKRLGHESDGNKPLEDRLGQKSDSRIPLKQRLGQKPKAAKPLSSRLGQKPSKLPLSMRLGVKSVSPIPATVTQSNSETHSQDNDLIDIIQKLGRTRVEDEDKKFKRIEFPKTSTESKPGTQTSESTQTPGSRKRVHWDESRTDRLTDEPREFDVDKMEERAERFGNIEVLKKRSRKFEDTVAPVLVAIKEAKLKNARFDRFQKFDEEKQNESD